MNNEALTRAIHIVGSASELARQLNISQAAISQWRHKRVPAARVLAIETATNGKVSRHELRPDLYPAEQGAHERVN